MKLSLKHAPQQKLAITPSLRQALHMLRMAQHELALWLRAEIEKNPLLALDETSKSISIEHIPEPKAQQTLHERLIQQMGERFADPKQKNLALQLLEHLDERGYLFPYPKEIPACDVEAILPILQSFDPPGIFARNLKECLLLQLESYTPAYRIISHYFQELLHGKWDGIKKEMAPADFQLAIQALSRLALRPADTWREEYTRAIIPDLTIVKRGNLWTIQTLDEELPKLRFQPDYVKISVSSLEETKELRAWIASGKWLMKSLQRRKLILLKIGLFLAQKQALYLECKGPLQPLTLQTLAHHVHMHPSTLSRAIHEKYAQTPRGLLPLRALFASDPKIALVKQTLKQLIAQEDKTRPLSDTEIMQYLQQSGLQIARRTIAKYRKSLKIGPALIRKYGV